MNYTSNGANAPTPAAPLSYTIPKKKRPLLDNSNHGTSTNPTTPPMPQQQQQLIAPAAREHVHQLARSRLLKKRHRPDPSALSTCTAPWSSHRERPSDASKGFGESRAPHSGQRDDSVAAAEEGRVRCQGAQFPPSSSSEDRGNNRWQQRPQDAAPPAVAEAAMAVKATAQGSVLSGLKNSMMDVEGGSGVQPREVGMCSPTGPNSANSGPSGSLTTTSISSTDSAPAAPQPAPQQLTRAAWDGVSAAAAAAAAVARDNGAVAVGAAASSDPVGQHIYGDTASGSWDPALRQSVADHARQHVSPQAKHRYSRSRAAMLDVKAEPVPLTAPAPPSGNRYGDAPAAQDPLAQAAAHGTAQQQQRQPAGDAGAAVHPHKRRRRALLAAAAAADAAADSGGATVGVRISASVSVTAHEEAQRQAIIEASARSSGGGQAKRVKSEGGERRARRAPRPLPQQQQQQAPPQQQQAPPQQQRRRRSDGPRRPWSKAAAAIVKAEAALVANHMPTTAAAAVSTAPAAGTLPAAAASASAATPAAPTAAAAAAALAAAPAGAAAEAAALAAAPAGAAAEAPASSRSGRARKPVLKFVSWEQGDLRTAAKGVRSGAPSGSRGDGGGSSGAAAAPRSQSRRSASRKRPRSGSDAAAAAAAAAMPVSAQPAQLSVAAVAAQPGVAAAGDAEGGGQGREAAAAAAAPQQRRRRRQQRRVEESSESGSDEEGSGARAFDWRRLEEQAREVAAMIMAQKRLLGKGGNGTAAAAGDAAAAAAAAGAAAMGEDTDEDVCLRRSARAAGGGQLDSICVQKLLANLRADHRDVEVLKLHHYLSPDANTAVMDAVLDALATNTNCQALYMQNFNSGVTDDQIDALAAILRTHDRLWCLNLGELYKVTLDRWWKFCEELRGTHVTHMYLSEHVLTADLKTAMRDAIRANRAKHALHKDVDNLAVIERCTNMWWNPINARDLQVAMVQRGLSTRVRPRADPASKAGGGGSGGSGGPARFEPCSLHTDKSAAVLAGAAAAAIVLSGGAAVDRCGGDACLSAFVAADGRGGSGDGGGGGGDGAGCKVEVFGSSVGACGGGDSSGISGSDSGSGSCGGTVAQSGVNNYYCGGNSSAVRDHSSSMPINTYGSIGGSAGGSAGGNGGVSKPAPARLIVEV